MVSGRFNVGSRGRHHVILASEDPSEFWSGIGFFALVFILVPLLYGLHLWSRRSPGEPFRPRR